MPLPEFSEDDVTNFMVTEALVVRGAHERTKARKDSERQEWIGGAKDWAKEQGLVPSTKGGRR